MADQQVSLMTPITAPEQEQPVPQVEQVVVVPQDVPQPEPPQPDHHLHKPLLQKDPPPVPEPEPETEDFPIKPPTSTTPLLDLDLDDDDDHKISQSVSFKEETTKVADLPDPEKKALLDLKNLIQNALHNHEFTSPPPPPPPKEEQKPDSAAPPAPTETETEEPTKQQPEIEPELKDNNVNNAAATVVAETEQVIEEKVTPAPAAAAAVVTVDDDGAKTVEAIEETIVAVSSAPQTEPSPQQTEQLLQDQDHDKAATDQDDEPAKQSSSAADPIEASAQPPEKVSIWGVPLLADDRTDVILLKFLRARDFKVKEAFSMIKNTVRWRNEFGIDDLLEQDLGSDLEKVVFMHGHDKEGHPVCYNVYGEFQSKELYQKTFSDEEKRQRFLRWRIQFLEKSIRKLDFSPGGTCTIVQVNDLKNSPGPGKWELRQATKQALQLLQDNYPEFVAKQVFINVPWWYLAVNRMISPFLTQRTKSKFVFAGPSKSAESLFRYIAAEQVPVKYGGLSKDGDFGTTDVVTEITLKPAAKHTVEFPVTESCVLTWEVRVVGWDVSYGAEFVPSAEESYTVIIQKARKFGANEEPVVCNSFKIGEPGKVVINIDNSTSKKKKLLYRLKTKPAASSD